MEAGWEGVWRWGGRGYGGGGRRYGGGGKRQKEMMYLSLHCHHQNDSCIKMGSGETNFNVSLIVKAKSKDCVHEPQPF